MKITDANRTRRGRISVYVEGEFCFAVEELAWKQSGWSIGQQITPELLEQLHAESLALEAKRRALGLLSARGYTSGQLRRKLAEKTDPDAAVLAVERMEELGLLDDEDYACRFAKELFENRRYAPRRIRLELQKRQLSGEEITIALSQFEGADWESLAQELLQSKFSSLTEDADCRRALSLLERYGYPSGIARSALRALRQAEDW